VERSLRGKERRGEERRADYELPGYDRCLHRHHFAFRERIHTRLSGRLAHGDLFLKNSIETLSSHPVVASQDQDNFQEKVEHKAASHIEQLD